MEVFYARSKYIVDIQFSCVLCYFNLSTSLSPGINYNLQKQNDTIFKAHLEPYNVEHLQSVPNRVFVRLPIHGYPVYSGALHINDDFEPNWIHFT